MSDLGQVGGTYLLVLGKSGTHHLLATSSQACQGECAHFRELLTDSWGCRLPSSYHFAHTSQVTACYFGEQYVQNVLFGNWGRKWGRVTEKEVNISTIMSFP